MQRKNGRARIKDLSTFIQWYSALSLEDAEALYKEFKTAMEQEDTDSVRNLKLPWASEADSMFHMFGWTGFPRSDIKEAKWSEQRNKKAEEIERFVRYAIEFEQPLRIGKWIDGAFAFLYIGNPQQGILVPHPEHYLEFVPATDYSEMTPGQVRAALGAPREGGAQSVVPEKVEAQLTAQMLDSEMKSKRGELAEKEREIEETRKHQTKELASIQVQIDALKAELEQKKATVLAELDRKKAEMERELEQLEDQMFLLDSQIYAIANNWLLDTRFGSFTDIIKQGNQRVTAGDMVLTVQTITPERSNHGCDQSWHNSRGRGDRNLTHDCRAEDCTIYPVNLVEHEEPVEMVRYRYSDMDFITGKERQVSGEIQKKHLHTLPEQTEILEEYEVVNRHVFVSLRKRGEFREYTGDARANVELYKHEYINLTYLNSVWLEWVINTKTLGDWKVHGLPVDYAYAIQYVKTALDHVRKREEREKAEIDTIDPAICRDPDWPVRLSEWKLNAGVRKITPYQAKRFVKAVSKNK